MASQSPHQAAQSLESSGRSPEKTADGQNGLSLSGLSGLNGHNGLSQNGQNGGLEARNLTKRYGPKAALEGVSFKAPDGGFTVILGPGGAGKTTTLRLLAGLEPQTAGTVSIGGREISNLAPKDRNLAMIFDNLALYPNKNGFQNLASPLIQRGLPFEEVRAKVFAMAEKLNLTLVLDRLPKTMSGGEKQRLALGRALVREPSFFLLDEPLSSLDAPLRFMIRAELKRLQQEEGRSFLMATPDFAEALAVADTIIMLRDGKIVQTGKPQEIYESPVDDKAALFVGSPRINLLKARFDKGKLSLFGLTLDCPKKIKDKLGSFETRDLTIGVRPENARLRVSGEAKEGASGLLPVVDIESLGRTFAVTVSCGQENLTIIAGSEERKIAKIGEKAPFELVDPEKLLAFDAAGRNLLAA
jgi:multiple sugar transport system ATP-binding protein